ncbi:hypothetical protein DL991_31715 [Amycolatopsis sp. WAC 01375]|uniref:hypothetical protein n=1 Tax=Amycolatopsis sp. WAC 01375 TaxID=2203194 RepID=UPI000F77F495|nr:hypothetical protein [Amycolatopsis sp. WAC 01375]RSM73316.1 hypothetical protein DL991_31715 [Amycolatopsis sp. WAC 01375]
MGTAIIVGAAVVVLAAAIVGGIQIFAPSPAPSETASATASSAPEFTAPSVQVVSNDQGIVPPLMVADPVVRGFLIYLDDHQVKYPASFAALNAGRSAAPYVCPYYGAKEGARDGRRIPDIVTHTPEWATAPEAQRAFVEAVFYTMCDGTSPKG